jgi:hypothetical protein
MTVVTNADYTNPNHKDCPFYYLKVKVNHHVLCHYSLFYHWTDEMW